MEPIVTESNPVEKKEQDWIQETEDQLIEQFLDNKGIGIMDPVYIESKHPKKKREEFQKIVEFLRKYMAKYARDHSIPREDISLEFINYGKTELVYVLTEKCGKRQTVLVKQPAVKHGEVKEEMENLCALKDKDDKVVAPIEYFASKDQELYVTPYINQARCIASYNRWGMYVPEPFYRFEAFTKEQEKIVNTCMIAKLVTYYDFAKREGIAKCKLGGGDFMLPKGWENETPTIDNTFPNLYFIAARKKLKCSFEEYLEYIRDEFSRRTIEENPDTLLLNVRGRVPMNEEDIEAGIHLGKVLIGKREESKEKEYKK